tara:strand:+ start:50 stop:631 length:582 start_codon:yes stop_codon:yes gene_type:complete
MATLFVDKVDPQSGTSLEIGSSGDTITIPSGCTITNNGTQSGFGGVNTPAFEAYRSSNQTISDNTATKIQFDTEVYDTAGNYDNSSNYRFTPTTAGKYFVYGQVRVQSANNSQLKTSVIYIYKNGSNVHETFNLFWNSYIRSNTVSTTAVIDMNGSSDYLEIYAACDANDDSLDPVIGNSERVTSFGAYKIIE